MSDKAKQVIDVPALLCLPQVRPLFTAQDLDKSNDKSKAAKKKKSVVTVQGNNVVS